MLSLVLLVVGAALLTAGAEGFAENVTAASSRLGVSVLALGLLLAGAEPEEAVTAMLAAGQGHPALAAGDAIGANLVILTLTLGLAALVTRLPVTRRSLEYGVAAAVLGAVAWLLMLNGVLGRLEGAVLVLLYVAGVVWVWRREQTPPLIGEMAELDEKGRLSSTEGRTDEGTGKALLMVLLGLLGMVVGGFLAVRGAEGLVDALGVGESVIGLTVLALATSAEMVALVWAARRRGLTEVVVAGHGRGGGLQRDGHPRPGRTGQPAAPGPAQRDPQRGGGDRGAPAGAAARDPLRLPAQDGRRAPGGGLRRVGGLSARPLACDRRRR